MADYQAWKDQTLGKGWDIDGSGDWDCVDMAKSWAVFLFGDWVNTIGYGNAKNLFYSASDQYFEKITNDPNDPNQLPQQGDIMMFDATPKDGYTNNYNNPYGHTGVLDSADAHGYTIIAQASGTGEVAHLDTKPWKFRPCIGWLRPKFATPAPANPMATEQEVKDLYQNYLHRDADPDGLAHYVGNYTVTFIAQDLQNSDEFKNYVPPTPEPTPVDIPPVPEPPVVPPAPQEPPTQEPVPVEPPSPPLDPTIPLPNTSKPFPLLGWFQVIVNYLLSIFKRKGGSA